MGSAGVQEEYGGRQGQSETTAPSLPRTTAQGCAGPRAAGKPLRQESHKRFVSTTRLLAVKQTRARRLDES